MTDAIVTRSRINSGTWLDDEQIAELLAGAEEDWELAGKEQGPWKVEVDCADLTKLLWEITERRKFVRDASG